MSDKKNSYLPLIFVVLAVGAGIVLRAYLLEYVIHPAANLLWFGWQRLRSVDQLYYWIGVIIFCVGVGLLIFVPRKKQTLRSAYKFDYLPPGRYEYWQELFLEARLGTVGKENLREALIQLIATVKSSRITSGEDDFNRPTASFEHFSDSTRDFLFPPLHRGQPIAAILDRISRRFKKSHQEEKLAIEEILTWIEKEMEIQYEPE